MPKPGVLPGERITQAKRHTYSGVATGIFSDADTVVTHRLGTIPKFVYFTPYTTPVVGYVLLSARTATSIVVRANVSGVAMEFKVEG